MKKNSVYKARRKVFLLGVMILFSLFLMDFASADLNDGLVSYWSMEDPSSPLIDNKSLNNLTEAGSPQYSQTGIIGSAINYNSLDDSFSGSSCTGLDFGTTDDFSISLWVYADSWTGDVPILSSNNVSTFPYYRINPQDATGIMGFEVASGAVSDRIYITGSATSTGNWHSFIFIRNDSGTDLWMFKDGVLDAKLQGSTTKDAGCSNLYFQDNRLDRYFDGKIDEVGIWNKSLSFSEITELYNSGSGLDYPFSEENNFLIYLISPSNTSAISLEDYNFTITLNMTGTNYSYVWKNATYSLWFSNGTFFNSSLVSGLSDNSTSVTQEMYNLTLGTYYWNVYGCYDNSTFGGCVWSDNNYTVQYVPFENTGESYSAATYETKNETFYLNISTISGTTNMGAFLVYNGTSYAAEHSCSGSDCQIWRKIDIPLVTTTGALNENKSFYWSITLFGNFGTSTTTTTPLNQNVTNLLFSDSGCQPLYNASINFTIYNETSKALINSDFKSTFNFWLGDGTVKDSYNFSGTGHNHYLFCISHNQSYITNSEIELTSGVNTRLYQFIKQIYDNTLKIQKLFIPDSAFISNIIIEVKNQGLVPEEDITVKISRYYPEYDEYEIVETKITDEFGQIIAKLVENDVIYKFGFYDSNGTLLKESDKVTVICRSTICVIPFIIETTDDYLDRYENLTLFDYELSFDNSTNIVTYAWDDQRGESATYRLEVVRYKFNESTVVCNTTSTTSVSSLTCNVGSNPSSYTIQVFRRVTGDDEKRISYLQIIVGDYSSTFGVEGLFWVFILLMICVGIGVYDPKVGAVLYGVGFIFMGILKIIYMPLPVFFANTLLVILFVWSVRT